MDIRQKKARWLVARREQLKELNIAQREFRVEMRGATVAMRTSDISRQIRDIELEFVRRALEAEDRSATLPKEMLDAIRRRDTGDCTRTVTELVEEHNGIVEGTPANRLDAFGIIRLMAISEEIERRVIETEDREAKARQRFVARILSS
jgi:hypothetical protein